MQRGYPSWGRYPSVEQHHIPVWWRTEPLPLQGHSYTFLPYGLGRSYGDTCLNDRNLLLLTSKLDRLIEFDPATGVLECESGVSFASILDFATPRGWFLPVTPGTKFVTVGGAIANDVHGKNHHCAGTFGHFVKRFELLRSDGSALLCSDAQNQEWWHATIGGLGLTGLITRAAIRLKPITSRSIDLTTVKAQSLRELVELSQELEGRYEYLVAWIDCYAPQHELGRGLLLCGNHSAGEIGHQASPSRKNITVPMDLPGFLLNRVTLKAFNALYYHRQFTRVRHSTVDCEPFFYPLDTILHWNRLYGRRGLLQWQCLLPLGNGLSSLRDILERVRRAGMASFLAVLKLMGDKPSLGMLSFARKGITVALDFPVRPEVFTLLEELDHIVAESGGVLYPAKDARMSAAHFQSFYPAWKEFEHYIDPRFSSSFWRRVTNG